MLIEQFYINIPDHHINFYFVLWGFFSTHSFWTTFIQCVPWSFQALEELFFQQIIFKRCHFDKVFPFWWRKLHSYFLFLEINHKVIKPWNGYYASSKKHWFYSILFHLIFSFFICKIFRLNRFYYSVSFTLCFQIISFLFAISLQT